MLGVTIYSSCTLRDIGILMIIRQHWVRIIPPPPLPFLQYIFGNPSPPAFREPPNKKSSLNVNIARILVDPPLTPTL